MSAASMLRSMVELRRACSDGRRQNTPFVSIFVQVYRTEPYLRRCIASVLGLAGDYDIEVLVLDDASPDRSWEIAQSFRDPRLTIRRHPVNQGANATANHGYAWARGKYVARIDSDDAYQPQFLRALVPVLEAEPEVGLAYGDIALIDHDDVVTSAGGNVRRGKRPPIGDEFFPLCERNFIPAPATLVRRSAILPLLPIPVEYSYLDWYMSTGVAERWQTAFCDDVLANYRVHAEGAHRLMIEDGVGEAVTFSVLDRLWANGYRSTEKRRARARVYGLNHLAYANVYLQCGLRRRARRCYAAAFALDPNLLLTAGSLRRYAATFVDAHTYDRALRLAKRGRTQARRCLGLDHRGTDHAGRSALPPATCRVFGSPDDRV